MHAATIIERLRPISVLPHYYQAQFYQAVLERLKPNDSTYHKALATTAMNQYRLALKGIPQQSAIYEQMGVITAKYASLLQLDQQKADAKALSFWREGLKLNPESVHMRYQIANAEYTKKQALECRNTLPGARIKPATVQVLSQ